MAGRTRVHELAKELGVAPKVIIDQLTTMGFAEQTSHSAIEDSVLIRLKESLEAPAAEFARKESERQEHERTAALKARLDAVRSTAAKPARPPRPKRAPGEAPARSKAEKPKAPVVKAKPAPTMIKAKPWTPPPRVDDRPVRPAPVPHPLPPSVIAPPTTPVVVTTPPPVVVAPPPPPLVVAPPPMPVPVAPAAGPPAAPPAPMVPPPPRVGPPTAAPVPEPPRVVPPPSKPAPPPPRLIKAARPGETPRPPAPEFTHATAATPAPPPAAQEAPRPPADGKVVPIRPEPPAPAPARPIPAPAAAVAPAPKAPPAAKAPAASVPPPVAEPIPAEPAEKEQVKLPESLTVAELAQRLKKKPGEILRELVSMRVMASINQTLEASTIKSVAERLGFAVEMRPVEAVVVPEEVEDPALLRPRPPVVTVMGHVDHGKTSLLDAIRKTNVTEQEFGGITQHIGAYQVETSHGKITFLDTPGHEAFTAMRARGAQATDIVILVVAADDGVMPQTVEAINHAKAGNVPIIVAVNKVDKSDANPDRVKQELTNHGLVPEEWGGQTIFVPTSAKKGTGVEQLLEMTALQAEILELKANPDRPAKGVVVEAKLDRGRGPVATVLVQQGTMREGDVVVAGHHYGRVRAMFNDRRQRVKQAGPVDPVEVLGLSGVPSAGDTLVAVDEERRARQIALLRQEREKKVTVVNRVTLADLHKQIESGEVKDLRVILKGDVHGSLEALQDSLERLSTDEVKVRVIHGAVGAITETDVMLASASNAIIIGFNVRIEPKAAQQASHERVDLKSYNVIYEAINDVKAALSGMLAPIIRELPLGKAQVRALFPIKGTGTIAGCFISEGKVNRTARVRVMRGTQMVGEGLVTSLKRFKDDAREVLQGQECGIGVEAVPDIRVGDVLDLFTTEEVARTL